MPQITLTFDTDKATLADVYQMLATATRQAQAPAPAVTTQAEAPTADTAKANRQAAAANARAAKGKKGGPVEQVLGPEEAGDPAQANGQDQDDDMGLVPPAMSPGEARDAALALVRQAYAAGHVAEVKALQKEYNVAKFYDVPVTEGHAFYQRVMQLLQSVGIQA